VKQAQEHFNNSYLFYQVHQQVDTHLMQTNQYHSFGDVQLVHFQSSVDAPWHIVLPMALIPSALKCFHQLLMHPGSTCMLQQTMNKHFTFPKMWSTIEEFVKKCDTCQITKHSAPCNGFLPLKDPKLDPWYQVQVDLIGPWRVDLRLRLHISIRALSAIDSFFGLCELTPIKNMVCAHVGTVFHNVWLCHYPNPIYCIHDNGPEFTAQEF
jgi:hypothetical protein